MYATVPIDYPVEPCYKEESLYMICPQCHKIPLISIISDNEILSKCQCNKDNTITLDNFFEQYVQPIKSEYCYNTKKHGDVVSSKYCIQCVKWLCDNCIENHNEYLSDHELTTSPLYQTRCFFHQNEKLTLFCNKCNISICSQCKEFHKEHDINQIMRQYSNEKYLKYVENMNLLRDKVYQYNKDLKNKTIEYLNQLINKVEESFNKNMVINEKLLKLYNILISNYQLTFTYHNDIYDLNISNVSINTSRCSFIENSPDSIQKVLDYFNTNYIIKPKRSTSTSLICETKTQFKNEMDIKVITKINSKDYIIFSMSGINNKGQLLYLDHDLKMLSSTTIDYSISYLYSYDDNKFLSCGKNQIIQWDIINNTIVLGKFMNVKGLIDIYQIYFIKGYSFILACGNSNNYNYGFNNSRSNEGVIVLQMGKYNYYEISSKNNIYSKKASLLYSFSFYDTNEFVCCDRNNLYFYNIQINQFKEDVSIFNSLLSSFLNQHPFIYKDKFSLSLTNNQYYTTIPKSFVKSLNKDTIIFGTIQYIALISCNENKAIKTIINNDGFNEINNIIVLSKDVILINKIQSGITLYNSQLKKIKISNQLDSTIKVVLYENNNQFLAIGNAVYFYTIKNQ